MISIIIPVLNEENTIGDLLKYLLKTCSLEFTSEIIVVDGGSRDNTIDVINNCINERQAQFHSIPKIKIVGSEKGRAKQMNKGALCAQADVLYFLHADSYPPEHFDQLIQKEVDKENKAGCFRMKFDHSHWWLQLMGWFTQFRSRACRGGDQSQFIVKDLFEEIKGFDEAYIIYEDNDLINKLYARNEFVVIQKWLTTSARKYDEIGIWRLQYHFIAIYFKKRMGAKPEDLYHYYVQKIVK